MPPAAPVLFSVCGVSKDGFLLGKEAKILLKKLSALLAAKWEKPHSEVCGMCQCSHEHRHCKSYPSLRLRGSRIPTSKMSNRLLQWEDKEASVSSDISVPLAPHCPHNPPVPLIELSKLYMCIKEWGKERIASSIFSMHNHEPLIVTPFGLSHQWNRF